METAELLPLHLLNASHHRSGRGSKVSLVTPEDTRATEVNEDMCQCEILQIDAQRQKDGPFQSACVIHGSCIAKFCHPDALAVINNRFENESVSVFPSP